MNKKGFTLVELLAVIVILVIIVSIAIPTITSTIERQKGKQLKGQTELLTSAIELYISDNEKDLNYKKDATCNILVKDLTDNDYIKEKSISDIKDTCFTYNNDGTITATSCTESMCTGGKTEADIAKEKYSSQDYNVDISFIGSYENVSVNGSFQLGFLNSNYVKTLSDSNSLSFEPVTLINGNSYEFSFLPCNGSTCACPHVSCQSINEQIKGVVKLRLNYYSDRYGNMLTLNNNKLTVPEKTFFGDGEIQLYACMYTQGNYVGVYDKEVSGSCLVWPLKFRDAS